MSSTTAKALTLLDLFTEEEPELGLSELARKAGRDKATVHRMLTVMVDAGLLEQRSTTKLYRLGAGVLRLARVRETAFPISSHYQQTMNVLSEETGETAHGSLISGRALATIAICESTRGSRVSLVAGEILPFHSTASGMAALAFSDAALQNRILQEPLSAKTANTVTDVAQLRATLAQHQAKGFSENDQGNEEDVYGIAVPIFDSDGVAAGTAAVATPEHRLTPELRARIVKALLREGEKLTFATGGQSPAGYRRTVEQTLRAFD